LDAKTIIYFNIDGEKAREMMNFFDYKTYNELYIYLKTFPVSKSQQGQKIASLDRNKVVDNLKMLDAAINDSIKKKLLKRDELVLDIRRNIPIFLLDNTNIYHGQKLHDSIEWNIIYGKIVNNRSEKSIFV
jgi:hypothetical protein